MKGFTLLELMVALVILGVGVLGFAGMTMLMSQGTRQARKLDEAATLTQSAIETLNAVDWQYLGNESSFPAAPDLGNGMMNAAVLTHGPVNRKGEASGNGPFPFYRSVVICTDGDTGVVTGTGFTEADRCGSTVSGTKRPPELNCVFNPLLTNREKMIRVMVTWTNRAGTCKHKAVDSLVFQ